MAVERFHSDPQHAHTHTPSLTNPLLAKYPNKCFNNSEMICNMLGSWVTLICQKTSFFDQKSS